MGISSISSVNANMMFNVSPIHFGGATLSDEIIKKLKALGIDPNTVKSEEEARALIAQAEKEQSKKTVQPQVPAPNVDLKKLDNDIKDLGDKLGINVDLIKDPKELTDTLDAGVKEFVKGAAAQSNVADTTVKLSTGGEVKGNAQQMQADFNSIKDRVDELENYKKTMFAGQDMLAAMNRMSFGI